MLSELLSEELIFMLSILIAGIIIGLIIIKLQFKKSTPDTEIIPNKNQQIEEAVSYTITPIKKEYLRYQIKRIYITSIPFAVTYMIINTLFFMISFSFLLKEVTILYGLISVIFFLGILLSTKKFIEFSNFQNTQKRYTINNDGISITDGEEKLFILWSDLQEFTYTKKDNDPDFLFHIHFKNPFQFKKQQFKIRTFKATYAGFIVYHEKENHEKLLKLLNNKLPYKLYL